MLIFIPLQLVEAVEKTRPIAFAPVPHSERDFPDLGLTVVRARPLECSIPSAS